MNLSAAIVLVMLFTFAAGLAIGYIVGAISRDIVGDMNNDTD